MTEPTDDDHKPDVWSLELDDGELLTIDSSQAPTFGTDNGRAPVTVRLPAWRAHDLSRVLHAYTQMIAVFTTASEVSGTEASLASALHDACLAALGKDRDEHRTEPRRISNAARLRAMSLLQTERPWLTYNALVGVVDAAAWWLDQDEDEMARGLLSATAGEDVSMTAWLVLLGMEPSGGRRGPTEPGV